MSDETPPVCFGEFALDWRRHELSRAGQRIPLRPKTLAVLTYLIENRERVVPRHELLRAVWPGVRIEMQGVYQSIAELRAAFGDRDFIRTVRSTGYQWTAELNSSPARSSPPLARSEASSGVSRRPAMAIALALLFGAALIVPVGPRWVDVPPPTANAEVLVEHAVTHFVEGELENAEGILSIAVAANPRHLGARLGLAQVLHAQGDDDDAFRIALRVYHDAIGTGAPQIRMESAILLSELRIRREDRETARAYAREAVELAARFHNPLVAGAGHERLGDIYLAEGERSLAELQLTEAANRYRGHCPSGERRVSTKLELIAGQRS